jgi:NADH-quinone oxidoreductase subunit A
MDAFLKGTETIAVDVIYLFAFWAAGVLFAFGPFVVVYLVASRSTRNYANKTGQFVECGADPIGDAWVRYSAVYFLYALVFIAFAVDIPFLVPVAMVYDREFAVRDLVEVTLFVGILSLVIVYAWSKQVFEWNRRQTAPRSSASAA